MQAQGKTTQPFESIIPVFEKALASSNGNGCALAIRVDGREVVSLWGGQARTNTPWAENTNSVLFSCTKGLVSLLAGNQISKGALDLDLPVAHYWPEFAAGRKGDITLRQALSHHAGLSALRKSFTKKDALHWETMTSSLAVATPIFPADGPHQYHAITFGWLIGEILRRVSGLSLGDLLQQTLCKPLGVEAWIGTPADKLETVSELVESKSNPPMDPNQDWSGLKKYELEAMTLGDAFPRGAIEPKVGFNDPEVLQAQLGGAGGVSSAKALAKIWSAAAGAEPALKPLADEVIADMTKPLSVGDPAIHMNPPYPSWGAGFMLDSPAREFLTPKSFGHDGFGGQVTFADQAHKVGFAFITNDMQRVGDLRATEIVRELRRILL